MSTTAKAGRVSIAVFGSRILGLVREAVFAHLFGAGMASDAFRAAFKIPNLLRDLFAEGALSTAFVTTFSKKLEKEGDAPAWRLANLVFTFQFLVLLVLTGLGIAFAPRVVWLIAGGMAPETSNLAAQLARVMFPFIMLVSAAAVMMGLLNAKGRFGLPAAASMFFNLGSILAGVLCGWLIDPNFGINAIFGMAIGVLVGGALQLGVQVPAALRAGFRFHWAWDTKDEGFRDVLRLLGPAVIGASAVQVNVLVNTNFASQVGTGAISWLEYAFRLMQFPIGLLGVAIATVTLPLVSRDAARSDLGAFRGNLARSVRLVFALTIPAAAGLALLAEPIIALVFERGGRFVASDTAATALALRAYSVGLAGYAAIKVLAPGFYALGRPEVPLRVSLFGIVLNAGMNAVMLFVFHMGHAGLALSTSLVALLNFAQLAFAMRTQLGGFGGRLLAGTFLRVGAATALMGAVICGLDTMLLPPAGGLLGEAARTLGLVGAGGLCYLGGAWMLRVRELDDLFAMAGKLAARFRGR